MRKTSFQKPLIIIFLTLILNMGLVSFVNADETDVVAFPPSDTLFQEIYLDEEGVIAFDSSGNRWYYDFEQQQFVLGGLFSSENAGEEDGIYNYTESPVEERCTEERFVDQTTRSVLVGIDEFVDGSIITVGRVTVKGWVKGNVTSFKRVIISSSGQVDGNVKAPQIIVKDGGLILGEEIITNSPLEFDDLVKSFSFDGLIVVLVFMVVFMSGGFILSAFRNKKYLVNLHHCIDHHKFKNPIVGFIFIIFSPLVIALVIITIVGIVIAPFVPFLYLLAAMMGLTAYSVKLGKFILFRIMPNGGNRHIQYLVGASIFWGFWLATAILLGSSSSVMAGFGILFLVISIIISAYPALSGIGAVVLTRFGFKEYHSWKDSQKQSIGSEAPAPPPIPQPPHKSGDNQ